MNARQKAKLYKRKYEELLNMPMPKLTVTNCNIDTLRFQRLYPAVFVTNSSIDYIAETIRKDLAFGIAEQLDKYVDYTTEFDRHTNKYRFEAEIKILRR